MSDIVIRAENLSKQYRIGVRQEPYGSLRESLMGALKAPFRDRKEEAETIWALKDVSFEIRRGEVVGVIGRNGAGKSTLLKILSRITKPTRGQAVIRGRVGSLLEVGTGFHPELTGRENIYLNGAILGMRRTEIERKFDEIVDFAEIEQFLDTPVKRYSSGMYVRLAFAVAAHLEPEILLVDEVLAVGDAAFQKKCLGKMGEVAEGGRTVVFVSHNMEAILNVCGIAIWLEKGSIVMQNKSSHTISKYIKEQSVNILGKYINHESAIQKMDKQVVLEKAEIQDSRNKYNELIRFGEPFSIFMKWHHFKNLQFVDYAIRFYNDLGKFVFAINTLNSDLNFQGTGIFKISAKIEQNVLVPGEYFISIGSYIRPHTSLHVVESCLKLTISNYPFKSNIRFSIVGHPIIAPQSSWKRIKS